MKYIIIMLIISAGCTYTNQQDVKDAITVMTELCSKTATEMGYNNATLSFTPIPDATGGILGGHLQFYCLVKDNQDIPHDLWVGKGRV